MARPEVASPFPFAPPRTLYHEYTLTSVFRTAPNALTNLKAKLKAAFRKKDKKPKEGDSAAGAAKADAPAGKFNVESVNFRYTLRNATRMMLTHVAAAAAAAATAAPGGEAPAVDAPKTEETVKPATDTGKSADPAITPAVTVWSA